LKESKELAWCENSQDLDWCDAAIPHPSILPDLWEVKQAAKDSGL